MEVFKLLPKTNCRKCNKPTCLAFAAAVFNGESQLTECPDIDPAVVKKYGVQEKQPNQYEIYQKETLTKLKSEVAKADLAAAARAYWRCLYQRKADVKGDGQRF